MPVRSLQAAKPRQTFEELCDFVEETLCGIGNLVTGQFPLTQRVVFRGKRRVGIYFCVHGPRSVKLTAIYDYPSKQAIFYGSDGIRADSVNLVVAPEPAEASRIAA
ncbi:MAG: hypothetical protein AAF664_08945 [Planctomycetota bacterium]